MLQLSTVVEISNTEQRLYDAEISAESIYQYERWEKCLGKVQKKKDTSSLTAYQFPFVGTFGKTAK